MSSYFNYIDTASLDKKVENGDYPFSDKIFAVKSFAALNLIFSKNQIIETILTIGLLEDFYLLNKLYSNIEIVSAIKSSNILDKKTANFCHLYFNIPKEDICACAIKDYSNYHLSMYYSFNIFKNL
jgi:hypothetical protein